MAQKTMFVIMQVNTDDGTKVPIAVTASKETAAGIVKRLSKDDWIVFFHEVPVI